MSPLKYFFLIFFLGPENFFIWRKNIFWGNLFPMTGTIKMAHKRWKDRNAVVVAVVVAVVGLEELVLVGRALIFVLEVASDIRLIPVVTMLVEVFLRFSLSLSALLKLQITYSQSSCSSRLFNFTLVGPRMSINCHSLDFFQVSSYPQTHSHLMT